MLQNAMKCSKWLQQPTPELKSGHCICEDLFATILCHVRTVLTLKYGQHHFLDSTTPGGPKTHN